MQPACVCSDSLSCLLAMLCPGLVRPHALGGHDHVEGTVKCVIVSDKRSLSMFDIIPSLYLRASFCKGELVSGNGLYVGQLFNENS